MSPKIHPSIWSDDDFSALDDAGKVLFLWLITNEATNNIGFLTVSRKALRDDTGKTIDSLVSLLQSLPRGFYYEVTGDRLMVWCRNFIRHQWELGQLQPNSRLFTNLHNLFNALPESFQSVFEAAYKPLVSHFKSTRGLLVPSKGPEQNRTEQNRTSSSQGECVGRGAIIPSESDVIAFAAGYQDLSRGLGPIPEAFALNWLAWRSSPKGGPFPPNWQADLRLNFTSKSLTGRVDGTAEKKLRPNGQNPESVWTVQQRIGELERTIERHPANISGTASSPCPTAEQKADYKNLCAELKKLRSQLAP